MKTKNQIFKGVATLFFCVAGVIGTMAQSSQSSTQVVCPGAQPYRVDVHGANVYLWTVAGGADGTDYTISSTTNASTTITWNNPAAAKSFSLSLKETTPTGCYEEVSVDVTVNPLPVPLATANTPCVGGTLSLTGVPGGMSTYAWTGPNGFTSAVQNPSIPAVTAAAAGTYTLTVSGGTGCSASATVDVVINTLPAPVASADTPCAGGTLTLTGAPNGMSTYAWTGPNGFTSAVQSPAIPTVTAAAAGTYTLTVTNGTGCSATATVDVIINPLPAPLATADAPCAGGTLSLTGAPNGMSTYAWSGPNGFTSAVQSPSIPTVTAAAAGTYTLTVTNGTGCSASVIVDVTINQLPLAAISYAGSPYCARDTAPVVQTGQGSGIYSSAPGLTIDSAAGLISLAASIPGTYTITYSFTNGNCPNTTTTSITIEALPPTTAIWHN